MNIKRNLEEANLHLLRKISSKSNLSQRKMALELGFSLGKLNYCLKELKKKGLIKVKKFRKNPNKVNYLYLLTPKGISEKTRITLNFMKKKAEEFEELKSETSVQLVKKIDEDLL
tara:strand:+ start:436 stop:780 length:345 start_codon:yes stop_codon:yes gene_type:complete